MDEQLLAEMTWVRRLARALLKDVDAADDVAQDAWLVASEHAPDDRPLRPWLARVVLNLVRMRGRGATRRQLRELATGDDVAPVPTSEELVERVEMQRVVAAEVVALTEPSRQTILLRYVEGLSSAEIARRLGIPDATVRRRLKRALDELRERLRARDDAPSGGWLAALAPLARTNIPTAIGALTMKKLIAVIAAIVIALLIVGGVWHARANHVAVGDDDRDEAARAGRAASGTDGDPGHRLRLDQLVQLPTWAAQAGVAPRRIAGRVVLGGKPVADATVRLGVDLVAPGARMRANLGSRALTLVAQVRTSASGAFDFGLQPAASFAISADATNAAPASISIALADPRVDSEHLVIALGDCRSRMSGTIRDAANVVARARVQVAGLGGTVSDSNGHYELCVPRTSMTGVTVAADGYGTITEFLMSLYGDLHHDFVLVPEAVVAGSVVDEAGAPVAAAAVIATPVLGDERHDTSTMVAVADADGRFELARLAPGKYQVRAMADRVASAQPTVIVATAGPANAELRLVVGHRARVSGHVMMAGAPIAGATVRTDRPALTGERPTTATSQRDGSFILDNVPPGTVALVAEPYEVRKPASITIDHGDINDLTIEVVPMASIRGRVTRHHEPVAGVRVGCSLETNVGSTTDATGAYLLEGLPAGSGRVSAIGETAGAFGPSITLAAGEAKTLDLELYAGGEIHGHVVDEAGAPVAGVFVAFDSAEDDTCHSMTDDGGAFVCATLVGHADYQPTVYPSPAQQQAFAAASGGRLDPVHVADGDAVLPDVRLAIRYERLTIHGKVVDDTGAVVADAHVAAGGADPGFSPIRARADGDGGFIVENLARGIYSLRAHAPNGSEAEVAGIAAGATGVQIVLAKPGNIEGTLGGFTSMPHVYAETPIGLLDDPREAVVTGNQFTFVGLHAGTYNVSAMVGGVQVGGAPAEVRPGVTTHVSLQLRPRAPVDGRVTELATGAPIAGAVCFAYISVAGSEAARPVNDGPGVQSDAAGHFTVDAPTGRARILCGSPGTAYSQGGGDFDVSGPTHVEVAEVKQIAPPSEVGFRLAQYTLPNTVISADATTGVVVGDQVLGIDGVSVANVIPPAAIVLAQNHRPGSDLVLQILHGGTPMTIRIPIH